MYHRCTFRVILASSIRHTYEATDQSIATEEQKNGSPKSTKTTQRTSLCITKTSRRKRLPRRLRWHRALPFFLACWIRLVGRTSQATNCESAV